MILERRTQSIITAFLIIMGIVLSAACSSEDSFGSLHNNDEEQYPVDAKWIDENSEKLLTDSLKGIIYTDRSYYRYHDGRNYIAFNRCLETPLIMDYDEITSLNEGDVIRVDRERSVTVDYIDVDPDWQTESLVYGSNYYGALPGKITVSDEYYFTHLFYSLQPDGSTVFDYNLPEDKQNIDLWELHDNNTRLTSHIGEIGVILRYDDLVWIPLSDDCRIAFVSTDGLPIREVGITELQDALSDYYTDSGVVWCNANASMDGNHEIYELQIHIYDSY
ncbi:MAG: hypothetical protein K6A80_10485 [Saccharofermentans sp.]|nr:hypothetical protein [Saccharofermentans sp.]